MSIETKVLRMSPEEFEQAMENPHRNDINEIRLSAAKYPAGEIEELVFKREEAALRQELADKVITVKSDLTAKDKENIYLVLTGISLPVKAAGRPATTERDMGLARAFLENDSKGMARHKNKSKVATEFELPGHDKPTGCNEGTFNKALTKGLSALKGRCHFWLNAHEIAARDGRDLSPRTLARLDADCLILDAMEKYEAENQHLKKSKKI